MSKWVSTFSGSIREETYIGTKIQMLNYLTDLMEDSHGFGWNTVQGCHAVLSVKMEERKIDWSDIDKINRVRDINTQRFSQSHSYFENSRNINKDKPKIYKFYQKGTFGQKSDTKRSQTYFHVCSNCFVNGKTNLHPAKDCKHSPKMSRAMSQGRAS